MKWPHWIAHRWDKWSEPREVQLGINQDSKSWTMMIQTRTCEACGAFDWRIP